MTHKKFGSYYVLRLFPGDELKESIRQFCLSPEVPRSGTKGDHRSLTNVWFFGIGAVGQATLSLYDTKKRGYRTKTFKQQLELVSVNGNVSVDGKVHAHAAFADHSYQMIGGHLEKAVISVTGEIILMPVPGKLSRKFDKTTGLNLLALSK